MKIGICMPPVPSRELVLEWARRAEACGFSSLGLLDRVVYGNGEPLITLAMAAAVTSSIGIHTEVLLAPLREPVLLAKEAATLDVLSGGRLTLGLGVGLRVDDFQATGADYHTRGRRMDEQLALMRRVWNGEPPHDGAGPVGPAPCRPGGPPILLGAFVPAAVARVARAADGLLSAADPEGSEQLFRTVEAQWAAAGRAGRPRLVGQLDVGLGELGAAQAERAILDYYGDMVEVKTLRTSAAAIRAGIEGYRAIGADEVMLHCWGSDPEQVDLLAALAGLSA